MTKSETRPAVTSMGSGLRDDHVHVHPHLHVRPPWLKRLGARMDAAEAWLARLGWRGGLLIVALLLLTYGYAWTRGFDYAHEPPAPAPAATPYVVQWQAPNADVDCFYVVLADTLSAPACWRRAP